MNRRRVSYSQLQALWEFLNSHREIATGFNKSAQAREHTKKMWATIANVLNAMGDGAAKSGPEWSKYWVDMKAKLKKKNRGIRESLRGTGGGPPTDETLSEMDIKFLQLLGEDFGCGLEGVQVPLFPEAQPGRSSQSQSSSSSEPIYLAVNGSADITQSNSSHLSDQASQSSSGPIYLDIDISDDIIASERSAETPPSPNSQPTHLIISTDAVIHSNVQRPIIPHPVNTTSSPIQVATLNPVPRDRGEDQIEIVPTEDERRPNADPPRAVPQESRQPNVVIRNRRTRQRRKQQLSAADARERLVTASEARARAELANSHSIREGVEILREILHLLRNRSSHGAAAALPTDE